MAGGGELPLMMARKMDGEMISEECVAYASNNKSNVNSRKNEYCCNDDKKKNSAEKIHWHSVKTADFDYSNLVCANCPPVLEHESFTPKLLITPKGETVLDFGQNIAGYIEFDMEYEEGEVWKFTHFETLDADGNFCNSNFQSTNFYCAQEIIYKAKAGRNHFKVFGTFMGFRYVKVEKLDENGKSKDQFQKPINAVPDNFKAHAVYSDLEILTDFQCGNPLVNQLYHNALWSIKGNLIDIPTEQAERPGRPSWNQRKY